MNNVNMIIDNACPNDKELNSKLKEYINSISHDLITQINILRVITKYKDIFDEFCTSLSNQIIKQSESTINELGYTAYDMAKLEPCLYTHYPYLWLAYLREDPTNAKKIINFLDQKIKYDSPIKIQYNINQIDNYLKTINTKINKNELLYNLYQNPDLANEYEYYIRTGYFIDTDNVELYGYSAQKLSEKYNMSDINAFNTMIRLRTDSKIALEELEKYDIEKSKEQTETQTGIQVQNKKIELISNNNIGLSDIRCIKVNKDDSLELVTKKLEYCKSKGINAYAEFNNIPINNINNDKDSMIASYDNMQLQKQKRTQALRDNAEHILLSKEEKDILKTYNITFEYDEQIRNVPFVNRIKVFPGESIESISTKLKICKDSGQLAFAVFNDIKIDNFHLNTREEIVNSYKTQFAKQKLDYMEKKANKEFLAQREQQRALDQQARLAQQNINLLEQNNQLIDSQQNINLLEQNNQLIESSMTK